MRFRRSVSMSGRRSREFNFFTLAAIALATCFPSITVHADEVTFEYDALGRLIEVHRSDGTKTIYQLDAAGNRTEVKEGIPPGIPASITVPTTAPTGSYTISWTAPTTGTVSAYELYESTSSGFSSQTLVYSGTALSKAFTAKPNGGYYYRVRACGLDCSGYRTGNDNVQVRPTPPASISSPAQSTNGSYNVTWGTSTGSFNRYQLQEATTSNLSGATTVYEGSNTSFNVSGRGNGTYYYRVRACGTGPCSVYRSGASTVVLIAPGAPASISVPSTSNSGDYPIGWGAAANGTVTTYELWEATNSSFTGETRIHNAASIGSQINGKPTGTYYYRVRACYQTSCSAFTTASFGVSVDRNPPTAPGTPTFSVSGTTITANWSASFDNIGVVRYETNLNGAVTWSNNGTSTSRTIAGLQPYTGYTFAVRAIDAAGLASEQSSGSFTTGTDAPPQPTGLHAAPYSQCSWRASWTASPGATYYKFKEMGSGEYDVPGSPTDVDFSCNTDTYETRKPQYVKACNSLDCSHATQFFSTDVTDPTPPGVPQFSAITPNSATATWALSTDASGIVAYQYRLNSQSWITIGTVTTVGLTSLTPQTNYTFEVRARDGAGRTGASSQASFTTPAVPDTTPPTPPPSVSMSDITHYNARADWAAASDNVGVVRYEYRLNNSQTWTNAGNVLSVVVPNLQGSSTYNFDVRAVDGVGLASGATRATFTTGPRPPDAPTGLSYSPAQNCSWLATWSSVPGASKYKLGETNGTTRTNITGTSYYVSCPYNNPDGNKPEWVQACTSADLCGDRAYF